MNNVYKHCQNRHGFRGKREDVEVDQELMVKIRNDLDYDYCGQSVQVSISKNFFFLRHWSLRVRPAAHLMAYLHVRFRGTILQ